MKSFLGKMFKKGVLQIVKPSKEIGKSYSEKSESNLISAKILLENGRLEEPVSLIYYSMYNLVLSLFFRVGIKSENHLVSALLLKEVFEINNSDILNAKKERIDKQYYIDFNITKKEVYEMLMVAEEFNRNLRGFILGLNFESVEKYINRLREVVR